MTTIAFKDGIIAADSQITQDDQICNYEYQKIHIVTKVINDVTVDIPVAMAGTLVDFPVFINWFKSKEDPLELPDEEDMPTLDEFTGLFYYQDEFYEIDQTLIPLKVGTHGALGSGSTYALGAMGAGVSAPEAVLVSKELDCKTGKSVYFIDVKEMIIKKYGN